MCSISLVLEYAVRSITLRNRRQIIVGRGQRAEGGGLALLFVAAHQFEKTEGVADRMDAADFVGVDGADRHRGDAETGAAGDDEHLGFVIKAARAGEKMRDEVAMEHAVAALGIGHVLPAEAADATTHVTVDGAPNERHVAHIIHAGADEEARGGRGGGFEEAGNLFRQMLAVGVEQETLGALRQAEKDSAKLLAAMRVAREQ